MGRTLICDSESKNFLLDSIVGGRDNFGLIVGQLSSSSSSSSSSSEDQAAFLAPTLPPQEDKAEFEEEDDLEDDRDSEDEGAQTRPPPPPPPPPPAIVLRELTPSWVTHHSQQLSRLLTGGLEIIGVFLVCSPGDLAEMMKSGKLKSFFAVLERQSARRRGGGGTSTLQRLPQHHSDRYLLHGCSVTKNISCRNVDGADTSSAAAAAFKPADVKYVDGLLDSWSRIDCRFSLDCVVDVPVSKLSKCSLRKQIQQGLAPTLKELAEARVVLRRGCEDGRPEHDADSAPPILHAPGAPLAAVGGTATDVVETSHSSSSSSKSSRKGGGRKGQGDAGGGKRASPAALPPGKSFVATVFKKAERSKGSDSTPLDCATQMVFKGTVCARAHLRAKATAQESIEALKDDMIQSILTRVELLCDDMLTEEDQETLPTAAVIYELPVRIFAPLGGGGGGPTISIADFMFRDERKADAVERIKEVTGKVVSEECLEVSAESFMPRELSAASSIESLSSHHSGNNNNEALGWSDDSDGLLVSSARALKRHTVSVLCVGGALAALFSAYLHFDDLL